MMSMKVRLRSNSIASASRLCVGEVWMTPNKLTSAEVEEILKLHKDYRAAVGASNMMELKWDPALADLAQGTQEHCHMIRVTSWRPARLMSFHIMSRHITTIPFMCHVR